MSLLFPIFRCTRTPALTSSSPFSTRPRYPFHSLNYPARFRSPSQVVPSSASLSSFRPVSPSHPRFNTASDLIGPKEIVPCQLPRGTLAPTPSPSPLFLPPRRRLHTSTEVRTTDSQQTTTAPSDLHQEETSMSSPKTPLSWVQLFDRSPAGFGVALHSGYHEIISRGTILPCVRKIKVTTTIDYQKSGVSPLQYRLSMVHPPVDLETCVTLEGVRQAESPVPVISLTMTLGRDLTGQFTVRDTFTWSRASVDFNGQAAATGGLDQEDTRTLITQGPPGVIT